MITNYTPLQLAKILEIIFPQGQWSTKDSEIITIPEGAEMPTLTEMDAAFTEYQSAQTAIDTRATTRTALRQQWDGLPAWINGPYRPLFDAANRLLDEGSDEAAFEMIDSVEPNTKITNDPEKSAIFATVKTQFLTVIESL